MSLWVVTAKKKVKLKASFFQFCASKNGHLVEITALEKQKNVESYLSKNHPEMGSEFWIGATDADPLFTYSRAGFKWRHSQKFVSGVYVMCFKCVRNIGQ